MEIGAEVEVGGMAKLAEFFCCSSGRLPVGVTFETAELGGVGESALLRLENP